MIYELKCNDINNYATLISAEDDPTPWRDFIWDGQPRHWPTPPKVEKFFDRKKQKERADIGFFVPGTIVLSQRARNALHDYLVQFGQLLPLNCSEGEAWLFNATHLLACVDYEKSQKTGNAVSVEILFEDNIPTLPLIFKDVHTAKKRIYLNAAAKQDLEALFMAHHLNGWQITQAGLSENY